MFKVDMYGDYTVVTRNGNHAATIRQNSSGEWVADLWGAYTGKGRQTPSGWTEDLFVSRMEAEVYARRELKII